jgi:hypothetical protein
MDKYCEPATPERTVLLASKKRGGKRGPPKNIIKLKEPFMLVQKKSIVLADCLRSSTISLAP